MDTTPTTATPTAHGAPNPFPFEGWPQFSTNIDVADLALVFLGTPVSFWRDGLGPWSGRQVTFPEGTVYFLGPPMPGWGAGIWHAPEVPAPVVAAAIAKRFGDKALFITPDGVPVPRVVV